MVNQNTGWNSVTLLREPFITSNTELSDRDKLEHLKDALDGKAKLVVAGFRLTEATYKWQSRCYKTDLEGRRD